MFDPMVILSLFGWGVGAIIAGAIVYIPYRRRLMDEETAMGHAIDGMGLYAFVSVWMILAALYA